MNREFVLSAALLLTLSACSKDSSRPAATQVTAASTSQPTRGVVRFQNGVGSFQQCGSTQALPMASSGEEYAFLKDRSQSVPGASQGAVVTVAGHLENQNGVQVFVVDRVDRIAAGAGITCDSP